jgi:drug/metabolite transporter (DMT)-like permease
MHPSLYALISIVLWCFSGACFRMGSGQMPAMLYLAMITGGGAAVALLIQTIRGRSPRDALWIPGKVAFAGTFGVAIYTIMLALAFAMAPERDIGTVNLINYLWPVWMVLLQCAFFPGSQRWLPLAGGILLGFAGLLLTRSSALSVPDRESLVPFLLALAGGLLWALYSVLLKKWNIPESKGGTTFHFSTCAVMALVLHGLFPGESRAIAWDAELVFWVVFGAAGPVGTAYYFWELAVKRGNPVFIAALSYFIPVGSSLALGLLFSETLTPGLLPGALLIAAGAWVVRRGSDPRTTPQRK